MAAHNGPLNDIERIAFESLIRRDLAAEQCLQDQLLFVQADANRAQLAAQSSRRRSQTATSALEAGQTTITSLTRLQKAIKHAVDVHITNEDSTDDIKPIWRQILPLADALLKELNTLASRSPSHTASLLAQAVVQDNIKAAAERSLAAIKTSLASIRNSISEKKLLLHPLRRVPTEILEIVFLCVVNADRERLREGFLKTSVQPLKDTLHLAPFTLAAVCRRWRGIATELPCLWTFLLLPRVSPNVNYLGRPLGTTIGADRFDRSLALSKDKELELTIYGNASPDLTFGRGISPYLNKVAIMSRVAHLNIIGVQAIAAGLPSAKVVHIYGSATGYLQPAPLGYSQPAYSQPAPPGSGQWPPFGYGHPAPLAPYLAHKQLLSINVATGAFLGAAEIVFHQSIPNMLSVTTLQTLHLRVTHGAVIRSLDSILRSLRNLRHLLLTSPSDVALHPPPFGFGTPSGPTTVMSSLATLTVTSNFLTKLSHGLLRGLLLPSLTTLILADIFNLGNVESVNGLQGIISSVTHVEFHRVSSRMPQVPMMRALLERIPNLVCLTLVGTALGPGLTALSSAPRITVGQLVVKGSDTEGGEINNYVQQVAMNRIFGVRVAVSLVDCPRILPHFRSQLFSEL